MTDYEITSDGGTVFTGSYGDGVKGHRLIGLSSDGEWGGGFFSPAQLREIAALLLELAEEADEDD